MAKKPSTGAPSATHYRLTVKRPVTVNGIAFNPGSRYTVKAAVYDKLTETAADAIASANAMAVE
jgi:hypothetical protein